MNGNRDEPIRETWRAGGFICARAIGVDLTVAHPRMC
jgi:hypothetical protein